MVLGLGLLINRNFVQGKFKSVRWFLIGFANFSLVCAILIGGIPQLIIDEGEEIQETGWYGQISVLIFLTCILEFIACLVFGIIIGRIIQQQEDDLEKEAEKEHPYTYF